MSTGECVEFDPRGESEWTYTYPLFDLVRHYDTLEAFAREIWVAAEAADWEPDMSVTRILFWDTGKAVYRITVVDD